MVKSIIVMPARTSAESATATSSNQERRAPNGRKVLIIGLDGATFDVLDPLMQRGRMPRLTELIDRGVRGILQSTTPPITPAAWTTFLTGMQPGRHGVIDFERYDPLAHKLSFNSTRTVGHVRNLWRILSDHGLRVGSLNVPMTFPAVPVNGFLISGFETPGPNSDFVYPPDLKTDILDRWPDPTLRAKWRRKFIGGDRVFAENIDYVCRSFQQGVDMTRYCGDRYGWDVLMVVLKLVDNLQHKTWKYLDPRYADRDRDRRQSVEAAFGALDRAIGDFTDYAAAHGATIVMVSDHGHGSLEGKIQANLLLRDWGYLSMRAGGAQGAVRGRYLWDRWRGRTRRFARAGDIAHDLAVDFGRSSACVMHAGMAGFLYINLKGRQPCGIVEPEDYEPLRDKLRARFLGPDCRAVDSKGALISLFEAALKPEELYGCTRAEQPWLPDLLLVPHRCLAVIRKIRGRRPVRWYGYRRMEGTHRPEGVLMAYGPGVAIGRRVDAQIADCAPTVLALLGLPIPAEMQGRVLFDLFESRPAISFQTAAATSAPVPRPDETVYSSRELELVTQRLSNLGYLE